MFIVDSGATSHMVNLEENMTNLKNAKTRVTVRDCKTITRTKFGDWQGWQKHSKNIYHVTLINMSAIPFLNENLFSMTLSLQKGFQMTSEGETQILKKNSTKIRFYEKMANKAREIFLLTTNFYKSANNAPILVPENRNPEGEVAIQPEGTAVKKQ